MFLLKFSAIFIGVGSILFLIAAFSPISRVFSLPTPETKLELINKSPQGWRASQWLFFLGALIFTLGVAVFAISTKEKSSSVMLYFAVSLLVIGLVFWSWHLYLRTLDPVAFVQGVLPAWQFMLYAVSTLAAFFLIGITLNGLGFPSWGSWVFMIGSIVFLVLFVIFKDLPPLVFYVLGLILSFLLFRAG